MTGRSRVYPQIHDREWMDLQIQSGRSYREIAAEVGCTPQAARDVAVRMGILNPRARPGGRVPILRASPATARALGLPEVAR
jgi:hypothetical protein